MKKIVTIITLMLAFFASNAQTVFNSSLTRVKDDINIEYQKTNIKITLDIRNHTLEFVPESDGEWSETITKVDTFYSSRASRTVQVWTDNAYYEYLQYRVGKEYRWKTHFIIEYPYEGVDQRKYTQLSENTAFSVSK